MDWEKQYGCIEDKDLSHALGKDRRKGRQGFLKALMNSSPSEMKYRSGKLQKV